jgi:hypothetical protein
MKEWDAARWIGTTLGAAWIAVFVVIVGGLALGKELRRKRA